LKIKLTTKNKIRAPAVSLMSSVWPFLTDIFFVVMTELGGQLICI